MAGITYAKAVSDGESIAPFVVVMSSRRGFVDAESSAMMSEYLTPLPRVITAVASFAESEGFTYQLKEILSSKITRTQHSQTQAATATTEELLSTAVRVSSHWWASLVARHLHGLPKSVITSESKGSLASYYRAWRDRYTFKYYIAKETMADYKTTADWTESRRVTAPFVIVYRDTLLMQMLADGYESLANSVSGGATDQVSYDRFTETCLAQVSRVAVKYGFGGKLAKKITCADLRDLLIENGATTAAARVEDAYIAFVAVCEMVRIDLALAPQEVNRELPEIDVSKVKELSYKVYKSKHETVSEFGGLSRLQVIEPRIEEYLARAKAVTKGRIADVVGGLFNPKKNELPAMMPAPAWERGAKVPPENREAHVPRGITWEPLAKRVARRALADTPVVAAQDVGAALDVMGGGDDCDTLSDTGLANDVPLEIPADMLRVEVADSAELESPNRSESEEESLSEAAFNGYESDDYIPASEGDMKQVTEEEALRIFGY